MIDRAVTFLKSGGSIGVMLAIALSLVSLISNYSARSTKLDYVEKAVAQKADQRDVDSLKEWMKRVDDKLDRLLEQKRGR